VLSHEHREIVTAIHYRSGINRKTTGTYELGARRGLRLGKIRKSWIFSMDAKIVQLNKWHKGIIFVGLSLLKTWPSPIFRTSPKTCPVLSGSLLKHDPPSAPSQRMGMLGSFPGAPRLSRPHANLHGMFFNV
jgi:hypothetical protein